jgi:hypothetical protein
MSKDVDQLMSDCDAAMERIADVTVTPAEAEELSNLFLGLTYRVNNRIRELKNDLIPLELKKTLSYNKAFKSVDDKVNVSKAKALASADTEYLSDMARQTKKENEVDYWKRNFDVLNNAHIFFKSLTRA